MTLVSATDALSSSSFAEIEDSDAGSSPSPMMIGTAVTILSSKMEREP